MRSSVNTSLRQLGVNLFCWILYYSGSLWLLQKIFLPFLSPKALVLYLHRVRDRRPEKEKRWLQTELESGLTKDLFEKQMRLLAHSYHVIALEELVLLLRDGAQLRHKTVCITFDDGYEDDFLHALPILSRYNLPATIFVVSGFVGTNKHFWWDELSIQFRRVLEKQTSLRKYDFSSASTRLRAMIHTLEDRGEKELGYRIKEITKQLKREGPQVRDDLLCTLRSVCDDSESNLDGYDHKLASWEQLKEMQSHRITIAAHSVTHPELGQLTRREVSEEISLSKAEIERNIGQVVTLFSYPSGDFSADTKALLGASGYRAGVTTRHGRVDASSDLFELNRVGVVEETFKNIFGRFSRSIFQVKMSRLFVKFTLY